jgi:hypothetical protein
MTAIMSGRVSKRRGDKASAEDMVISSHSSLRGAKRRSNPDYFRGEILDCFAPLAMTG